MAESTSDAELRDLICLTMVPGVGPHTSRALLERFGTAGRVLDASVVEPRATCRASAPSSPRRSRRARRENRRRRPSSTSAAGRGVRSIARGDAALSAASLEDIPDPPSLLYVRGDDRARRPARDRPGRLAAVHAVRAADRRAAGDRRWPGSA